MTRHGWNRNLGEPVARPVATSCSDLPRRPVWPDKSSHFVHTFCTNKLHLVATCRVVTASMVGQLQTFCTQFGQDVWIFFRPCRDGRTWFDKHTHYVRWPVKHTQFVVLCRDLTYVTNELYCRLTLYTISSQMFILSQRATTRSN